MPRSAVATKVTKGQASKDTGLIHNWGKYVSHFVVLVLLLFVVVNDVVR